MLTTSVAYFTKEVNPSLAKLPLNFSGRLAKLRLTSLVKEATRGALLPTELYVETQHLRYSDEYYRLSSQHISFKLNIIDCQTIISHFHLSVWMVRLIHPMIICDKWGSLWHILTDIYLLSRLLAMTQQTSISPGTHFTKVLWAHKLNLYKNMLLLWETYLSVQGCISI